MTDSGHSDDFPSLATPRPTPSPSDNLYAELGDLTAGWTAAMRRRGLAGSTIRDRVHLLTDWWHFTAYRPLGVTSWRTVEAFLDAREVGTRRRTTLISNLHTFYAWAIRAGLTRTDPTAAVERPRSHPGLPRPMTDMDLVLALAVSEGPVHAAIVVGATCGLRCVELCRLRWIDVTPTSLRVDGKGHRERVIPLHPAAADALETLERRNEWVFPWREDRHGTGSVASQALRSFLRGVGLDTSPHQLRHWCATRALAATGDLRAVQELLGHASPATTAIYTRLDPTRLAHVVEAIQLPIGTGSQLEETIARS